MSLEKPGSLSWTKLDHAGTKRVLASLQENMKACKNAEGDERFFVLEDTMRHDFEGEPRPKAYRGRRFVKLLPLREALLRVD